jgi:hypothetical protein
MAVAAAPCEEWDDRVRTGGRPCRCLLYYSLTGRLDLAADPVS